jgi:hypothetical protein
MFFSKREFYTRLQRHFIILTHKVKYFFLFESSHVGLPTLVALFLFYGNSVNFIEFFNFLVLLKISLTSFISQD